MNIDCHPDRTVWTDIRTPAVPSREQDKHPLCDEGAGPRSWRWPVPSIERVVDQCPIRSFHSSSQHNRTEYGNLRMTPVDVRHMSVPTEPGWSVLCLFWILSDRVQFSLTMSDRDFMARAG